MVIVKGVGLYTLYSQLEKLILDQQGMRGQAKEEVSKIRVNGGKLEKMFQESYDRMGTKNYDPEKDF